jgi:hypothetical protein
VIETSSLVDVPQQRTDLVRELTLRVYQLKAVWKS